MTSIVVINGLPFVSITLRLSERSLLLSRVLLDTGSATTIIKTDHLMTLGVIFEGRDRIRRMIGIGGTEYVVEKQVDTLELGNMMVSPYIIQAGAMSYSDEMDGILGLDFMLRVGAIVDFKTLNIRSA